MSTRPSSFSVTSTKTVLSIVLLQFLVILSFTAGFSLSSLLFHARTSGVNLVSRVDTTHHPSLRADPFRNERQALLFSQPNGDSDKEVTKSFYIRQAMYADLGAVADIVMNSFYSGNSVKGPWKHIYRLGELNRLQQNFPYNDELHCMLVAACPYTEQVVAFVDVDARPPRQTIDPPRPYLSDLCTHNKWRRNGIAKRLIQKCEEFVLQMKRKELYIRVEQNNTAAIQMYEKLEYSPQPHDYFGVKDTTILLRKKLVYGAGEDSVKVTAGGGANVMGRS